MTNARRHVAGWLCAVVLAAGPAAAQEGFPADWQAEPEPEPRPHGVRLDGAWADFGAVNLTKGNTGLLVGGNIGLGTLFAPWIDFSGGVRYWKADAERPSIADSSKSEVRNLSFHPDLRAHMFRYKWMRPYVLVGLAAQFVSADIPDDTSLEDAISGFRVGLDTGFGISSAGGSVRWHAETRREFVEDVGNWTFAAGIGWWPDVHAEREPARPVRSAYRQRAAEDSVPAAPPLEAVPVIPVTPAEETVPEPLVRDLMQKNEALRAEMDSLRRSLDEQRAKAAAPAPESVQASPPATVPAPDRAALSIALERMAASSTLSHLVTTDEGWRLVLGGEAAFESGSGRLTPAAREEIRSLSDVLLRNPGARVIVEGHSDSAGDALNNLTLSEDRAASVRNEMILSGVDPATIRARGLGSGVPVADNSTAEGRSRNRRVEIRVLDPK